MRADRDRRIAAALEPALAHGTAAILAVSGGPDSTALLHAAATLAPGRLHVATIDHGLRPESRAEAVAVGAAAGRLGLPHRILAWDNAARPAAGVQAAARAARYRLLAGLAREVGADRILTGHTLDDQAETVLMRLIAGSGLAGLSGMRVERDLAPGLRLVRPFLAIPKADLVAWCEARGIGFLRDPSNADDRYARARLRRLLPDLAREGLDASRLARFAERAARDEAALRRAADEGFAAARAAGEALGLRLDGAALLAQPEAVTLRLMERAVDAAGGEGPHRLERLERLTFGTVLPALRAGRTARGTLRGLVVTVGRDGTVTLTRAPPRRRGAATTGAPEPPSELLGKGGPATYIGPECEDDPPVMGKGSAAGGPHSPRIDR
ncbi:tRNA lysidine(34) synthetase TilS [Methylobacterium segetis]|uniref:tRNA lysidine(34) synthetase TilS n=1 Tax=Methylobacterium segetis TaxID=2488750 RepID=UPI0010509117|nr:tRNA lysidine(34) synthetase TilS [Methylobacterium segetis]